MSALRPWLPPICVAIVIFALSSTSAFPAVPASTAVSIFIHMVEYGALAAALVRPLKRAHGRVIAWAVSLSIVYGITDEIHQLYVPGRSATGWDLIPDAIGATAGAYLAVKWWQRKDARLRGAGAPAGKVDG